MSRQSTRSHLTQAFLRALRTLCHVSALVFGAFWLVATTALPPEPRECFSGLGSSATIEVQIGERSGEPGQSCAGRDGIVPGATLVFALAERPRSPSTDWGCYNYQTESVERLMDVTVMPGAAKAVQFQPDPLTATAGRFSPAQFPDCEGSWRLELRPEMPPPAGDLLSPLDAGPTQRWLVERLITIPEQEKCGSTFTGTGRFQCGDVFAVESIVEPSP